MTHFGSCLRLAEWKLYAAEHARKPGTRAARMIVEQQGSLYWLKMGPYDADYQQRDPHILYSPLSLEPWKASQNQGRRKD